MTLSWRAEAALQQRRDAYAAELAKDAQRRKSAIKRRHDRLREQARHGHPDVVSAQGAPAEDGRPRDYITGRHRASGVVQPGGASSGMAGRPLPGGPRKRPHGRQTRPAQRRRP